jgi:hypothetical protein
MKNLEFIRKYAEKMVKAEAGAEIFVIMEPKPELEPHKNRPAPQHWFRHLFTCTSEAYT